MKYKILLLLQLSLLASCFNKGNADKTLKFNTKPTGSKTSGDVSSDSKVDFSKNGDGLPQDKHAGPSKYHAGAEDHRDMGGRTATGCILL